MKASPGETRPERYPRVKDWKKYRDNFDAIFGKKKRSKKSEKATKTGTK